MQRRKVSYWSPLMEDGGGREVLRKEEGRGEKSVVGNTNEELEISL